MSTFSIILVILAIVLAIVGILGALLPALPGPPLNLVALYILYFAVDGSVSVPVLVVMTLLTIVVSALDYVSPILLTKIGGGSKAATWGTTLGLIVGLFYMPIGLVVGPFIGAFAGELLHEIRATVKAKKQTAEGAEKRRVNVGHSLKVAMLSFLAFLLSTGLKLIASLTMTVFTFIGCWHAIAAL